MPEDRLDELFSELATTELPLPPQAGVIARGRQRRRKARLMTAAAALVVVALAGSLAGYLQHAAGQRVAPQAHATKPPVRRNPAATLPPAGSGQLVLGTGLVGSDNVFEMARTGSATAVPVTSLTAVSAGQSVIAANPGGGWVVSEGIGPVSQVNEQAERLALVSATGTVEPFGPLFSAQHGVSGIAVRPDGSAVAVALTNTSGPGHCMCSAARIELIPLPGHQAPVRTWTLASSTMTIVRYLSWASDGTELTYFPGGDETGGGFSTRGAATLDTAGAGDVAPAATAWPGYVKGSCNAVAGTWDGSSYLVLDGCDPVYRLHAADPTNGAAFTGPSFTVPLGWGCGDIMLDPTPAAGRVLISGCGSFLVGDRHATRLPTLPSGLTWVSEG